MRFYISRICQPRYRRSCREAIAISKARSQSLIHGCDRVADKKRSRLHLGLRSQCGDAETNSYHNTEEVCAVYFERLGSTTFGKF
ncbi:hypothetical protein [Coleofasciculus sp. H7-2]|uniref:hypothetical protein n=1 Tax=Coleofasciculus sp. H7-2 TaxID=3351545 RepID=UPI0036729A38